MRQKQINQFHSAHVKREHKVVHEHVHVLYDDTGAYCLALPICIILGDVVILLL